MRLVRPTSSDSLSQALERAAATSLTYSDLGVTLAGGGLPSGYNHDRYEVSLGEGVAVFERAVEGLQTWRAHRGPGLSVYPPDAAIQEGHTVIVCMGKGLAIAAPCRIVKVVSESNRWGFAYGTLPGHPEQGEESFTVSSAEDKSVTFAITAFSRPSDRFVKLAGPISRAIQKKATEGYLRSLRRFVVGSTGVPERRMVGYLGMPTRRLRPRAADLALFGADATLGWRRPRPSWEAVSRRRK